MTWPVVVGGVVGVVAAETFEVATSSVLGALVGAVVALAVSLVRLRERVARIEGKIGR